MRKTRKAEESANPTLLTRKLAASKLGLSPRRVFELSKDGTFTRHTAIDPVTKRKAIMFDPAEIDKFIADRKTGASGNAIAPARLAPGSAQLARIAPRAITPAQIATGLLAPLPAPPAAAWLTLDAAAEYTGLSARLLYRLIAAGELAALDEKTLGAGRWRVKRADLDALEGKKRESPKSA